MIYDYSDDTEKVSLPIELYIELGHESVDVEIFIGDSDEAVCKVRKPYLELIHKMVEYHTVPFLLNREGDVHTDIIDDVGLNELETMKDTFQRLVRYIDYKIDEAKLKPRPEDILRSRNEL